MPMPPPKASTEGPRDRQVFHEMGQIVRALEATAADSTSSRLVGADYWEGGRFDRALAFAVADGLVHRGPGGVITPPARPLTRTGRGVSRGPGTTMSPSRRTVTGYERGVCHV